MLKKILIANRGEIAVRIIRACRDLGIISVAVYSREDSNSMHVQLADERICIGSGPVGNSYLNQDSVITAALNKGAEAIHPGYGFLSENAGFARKCRENGLVFIGPDPDVISLMGNKSEARKTMMQAGVPVVPGTTDPECVRLCRKMSLNSSSIWLSVNLRTLSEMTLCILKSSF